MKTKKFHGKVKVLEERENPFPDDLEGRLNAITNVVNTELKTLTLLHLDDKYVDGSEIRSRLIDTVGYKIYIPYSRSFRDYCSRSLLSIGTVAEGDIQIINARGSSEFTGYKLTEAGKKYGRPIAAFTLDYVSKTRKSMFEILGSTMSSGKTRAPLNRIKILEHLGNKGELRLSDLAKIFQTDDYTFIRENLRPLSKTGFVDYNSIGDVKGDNFVIYQWVKGKKPEDVKPYVGEPSLTEKVSEALFVMEHLNLEEARILVERKSKSDASDVLSYLVREGFAKRISEFTSDERSRTSLFESGKQFLNGWVEPVKEALQDGDSLTEMQRLYESLISDEQRFVDVSRTGIKLYTEISPQINRRPREETNRIIVRYISENLGCRPKEICKSLNLLSLSEYSAPLIQSGVLTKKKEGIATKYFVNKTKAREAGLLI